MHSFVTYALAIVALLTALWAVFVAYHAMRYVHQENKRSRTLKQLTDIQTELTEHADSIAAMHESLHKLRSRVGMRALRDKKAANGSDVPNAKDDPDGYKRAMRLKLKQEGVLK